MTPVRITTRCLWSAVGFVLLWSVVADGQQTLPAPRSATENMDSAPPELPIMFGGEDQMTTSDSESGEGEPIPSGQLLEPIPSLFGDATYDDGHKKGYLLWDSFPAVTESTGTWLERGFWYTEVDAVNFRRVWNRSAAILATENASQTIFTDNRVLALRGAHPGYDTGVRFTLGHFLFRDADNRDHSVEFTVYSAGDFTEQASAASSTGNNLIVPFQIDGNTVGGPFDQADTMQAVYTSRINSFEANYHLKRRMRRDQMVLEPTGEWIRRASPTWTREFLAGVRFIDVTDRVEWGAQNLLQANGEDGYYLVRTDNNMVGAQIGGAHAYQTDRWSVSLLGKAGMLLNDAKGRQRLTITNDPNGDNFSTRQAEEQLSFLGEVRITSRVHLTPNWSIRSGYELMYLTNTALAAHQLFFLPVQSQLGTSGDPFYHGWTVGLEGYW